VYTVAGSIKTAYFREFIHSVGAVILIGVRAVTFGQEKGFKNSFLRDEKS
jgi:hypothetical protein